MWYWGFSKTFTTKQSILNEPFPNTKNVTNVKRNST